MSDTNKIVGALRSAMDDMQSIGLPIDERASLVGYFVNRLNALSVPHPETPAPLRGEVSDLQMAELFDKYVGDHSSKYPWEKKDFYDFARAVLRVAAPMPQSAGVTDEQILKTWDNVVDDDRAKPDDRIAFARSILALAPGLSGWQEIASANAVEKLRHALVRIAKETSSDYIGNIAENALLQLKGTIEGNDAPPVFAHRNGVKTHERKAEDSNRSACRQGDESEGAASSNATGTSGAELGAGSRGDEDGRLVTSGLHSEQVQAAPHQPQPEQHPDDAAVDAFAALMKAKMAKQRSKGYGGWETCPVERLQRMLVEHIDKGDPVDVANFAMMLSARGEATVQQQPEPTSKGAQSVEDFKQWLNANRMLDVSMVFHEVVDRYEAALSSPQQRETQEAAEVTEFNVGRYCLSEDDCIAEGLHFGAYERGVEDAAKAFGRNRRG